MREADPVHNVELRVDRYGHESVVFAFPYRREVVDAVRAIPGRRFDWEAKEWWALQADQTAPYVKGVIERHPWLKVAPDVERWLAQATVGWVGRVGAGKRLGAGRFVLETIAGELPEELDPLAESAGGRLWLPFTAEVAEALGELTGSRFDERALRCAHRLQVGLEPAPATLSLIESVGEPRFKLDVNWDPDTIPAFLALPACEAHGRSLPVDPYLLEPLEHYLRTFGVEVAPNAADVLERLRPSTTSRSRTCAARAPTTGRRSRSSRCSAASCARSSAPGWPTRCARGGCSSPTSRASARPCRRWPRSRPTTPTPPWSSARRR